MCITKDDMMEIDILIADLIGASFECGVNFQDKHYSEFLKKSLVIHRTLTDKLETYVGEN
jgi:hypothetical protein